jgi:hypothetical protein
MEFFGDKNSHDFSADANLNNISRQLQQPFACPLTNPGDRREETEVQELGVADMRQPEVFIFEIAETQRNLRHPAPVPCFVPNAGCSLTNAVPSRYFIESLFCEYSLRSL